MPDTYGQGEPLRCLTVKGEATRFCLAIEVGRLAHTSSCDCGSAPADGWLWTTTVYSQ